MRYVVLRDDDTNALTPVEYLDRLYRPFLERKLPVNLAVIPEVTTKATMANGQPEGFLLAQPKHGAERVRLEAGSELARYLQSKPLYEVAQHGCHHEYCEFDLQSSQEAAVRLDKGRELLIQAGFPTPETFIAPHDKISRISYRQLARRYKVISTGWFELRRLPLSWWPKYALVKSQKRPHWRTGKTVLLSHPGCLLSCHRPYEGMLERVQEAIHRQQLTVLVTHWWEYFRGNKPDDNFIAVLHEVADYLGSAKDVQVISFRDVGNGKAAMN
jgi:hypothetical protein